MRRPRDPFAGLFDAAEGARRRDEGMTEAASNPARLELLDLASYVARRIAASQGSVTSDQVAERLNSLGCRWEDLGNAAGSVFRGLAWTGTVVRSSRPSAHRRLVRVWALPATVAQDPRDPPGLARARTMADWVREHGEPGR